MKRLFGASLAIALAAAIALPADAADLPGIKASASNQVPACATPGRLMAYLRSRNGHFNDRFDGLATEYMRYGEQLGVRWDMAFFQMVLETGALSFTGDVRASQNNFAGLGAASRGKHGERFPDIATGVKAHLQHLLMYAGDHIDNPVAERTRKVQEWGVLTDWQKSIDGPITFALMAQQWSPGSGGYVRNIATISEGFYDSYCSMPDPQPQLVQEARKGRKAKPETQVAARARDPSASETNKASKVSATEIARRAIEEARKNDPPRTGLGAGNMLGDVAATARAAAGAQRAQTEKTPPAVKLINPAKPDVKAAAGAATTAKAPKAKAPDSKAAAANTDAAKAAAANAAAANAAAAKAAAAKGAEIQTASVAGAATHLKLPQPSTSAAKCKVWTASYGGQRAILIKAATAKTVNYTVLDVNDVNAKREVEAYIAAYAKGGEQIGSYSNQTKALDKAFELCPEG